MDRHDFSREHTASGATFQEEKGMTNKNTAVQDRYPRSIPFPVIERLRRPGCGGLSGVRKATDLPSRLIFGDLDEAGFKASADGWQAAYRDGNGNGLELSVTGRQFSAKSTFLGATGMSCGPVDVQRAFGELLNLGVRQWNAKLKEHLEARYSIVVPEPRDDQPSLFYLPDGWLRTILVPVTPAHLRRLLEWHLSLSADRGIAAGVTGDVVFAFNAVNYIEGRWDEAFDPDSLVFRSVAMTRTLLTGPVVRETGKNGNSALTVRRFAYVYRCTAFLRDIPYLVSSLDGAGLLPTETDELAAVLPAEIVIAGAGPMSWFSPEGDCRVTWVRPEDPATTIMTNHNATAAGARGLILEAQQAASEFEQAIGLSAALDTGSAEGRQE